MRLLITGASGFLGRNTLLALPSSWEVFSIYRPGNAAFLAFLKAHRLDHVQPVPCDLSDVVQVEQAVNQTGDTCDCCLYLASNTSIPYSLQRPVEDLTTNVAGLLHVLERWTFNHLVYLSSGAVYLGRTGLVEPTMAIAPALPYAISKLAAEHYIKAFLTHRKSPRHATIVRFFGAFGPYEPPRKLYTRVVRRFAFERNPAFSVKGDGNNYIDAMYIDDAVRALLAVLNNPPANIEIIDLGMGNCESVNEIVSRAARTFGLQARITHEGQSPEYITFHCDPQPFRTRYQVGLTISLEEGLRRLAAQLETEEL